MSPPMNRIARPVIGFPRVSGDEPLGASLPLGDRQFSPRERG